MLRTMDSYFVGEAAFKLFLSDLSHSLFPRKLVSGGILVGFFRKKQCKINALAMFETLLLSPPKR